MLKVHQVAVIPLFVIALVANAAPADDVQNLLKLGKDREAYEMGKSTPDALGMPLFDFYFGIAEVNAGVTGDGVLALERYLL